MIQHSNYDNFFVEARLPVIHVSQHTSFSADINEEYINDIEVSSAVKVVTQLFKDEDYPTLRNEYNDHELTKNLAGYRSLHLFYGTTRSVVIVYKKQKNGHIVFHRIGNHEKVYDPDYQQMDKNRRIKKRKKETSA